VFVRRRTSRLGKKKVQVSELVPEIPSGESFVVDMLDVDASGQTHKHPEVS